VTSFSFFGRLSVPLATLYGRSKGTEKRDGAHYLAAARAARLDRLGFESARYRAHQLALTTAGKWIGESARDTTVTPGDCAVAAGQPNSSCTEFAPASDVATISFARTGASQTDFRADVLAADGERVCNTGCSIINSKAAVGAANSLRAAEVSCSGKSDGRDAAPG
jgi:hypothetical protein